MVGIMLTTIQSEHLLDNENSIIPFQEPHVLVAILDPISTRQPVSHLTLFAS
jgi:hypothetical protein